MKMQQPPRDENGTIPHNHEEISSEDNLIRYLRPNVHVHLEDGMWRVSSAAFSPSSPTNHPRSSISVDLEKSMKEAGLDLPYRMQDDSFGLASIEAGRVREENLKVGWDPQTDNPHHCGVWGVGNNKSKRARLARLTTLLRKPMQGTV